MLLNNNALGKISNEQLAADYPVWHTSLHNPDWAAYAELCGATGIKVTTREQLDEAMATLLAATGPALLGVEQDAELLRPSRQRLRPLRPQTTRRRYQ